MRTQLGHIYRDRCTGVTGIATSRHEYLFGCERVSLQWEKDGDLHDATFDIGALAYVGPGPADLLAARQAHVAAPGVGGPVTG